MNTKILVLFICLFFLPSCTVLKNLGLDKLIKVDQQSKDNFSQMKKTALHFAGKVSDDEEWAMGSELAASVLSVAPVVENKEVQIYVQYVGTWIALQSERPSLNWRFRVLDSDTVNAFALPGGIVYITKPLFMMLQTESQLATVLAHEISHIVEKHHLSELISQTRTGLLSHMAFHSAKGKLGEDEARGVGGLLHTGKELYTKGLNRKDEFEADHRGAVLAARAGYNPFSLVDLLIELNDIDPSDPSVVFNLSTHPPYMDRLKKLDGMIYDKLEDYDQDIYVDKRILKFQKKLL